MRWAYVWWASACLRPASAIRRRSSAHAARVPLIPQSNRPATDSQSWRAFLTFAHAAGSWASRARAAACSVGVQHAEGEPVGPVELGLAAEVAQHRTGDDGVVVVAEQRLHRP